MTIIIRLRGPTSCCTLVLSENAKFKDLRKQVVGALSLDASRPFDILIGYPPKASTHGDDVPVSDILRSGESVRVQYSSQSGVQLQGVGSIKTAKGTKKESALSAALNPLPSAASPTFGARIASLSGSSGSNNNRSSATAGTRSGSSVQNLAGSGRRRRGQQTGAIRSEEDLSEALLSAADGRGKRIDQVLRSVFRSAVLYQYEETKAVDRVSAAAAGSYNIVESPVNRVLGTGRSGSIEVTFKKGPTSRSHHTDSVDLLSKELLLEAFKVALLEPESKEALKPMNLSRCSPRLFWSLVYHYGGDVMRAIRTVLEGIDSCEWLEERRKTLSEKALENAAQAQEKADALAAKKAKKAVATSSALSDSATATAAASSNEAISSVLIDGCVGFVEELANSRFGVDESVPEAWRAALQSALETSGLASSSSGVTSEAAAASESTTSLLWKLAACEASEEFIQHIHAHAGRSGSSTVAVSEVEEWIASAQHIAVQAIWHVVCGGGASRLRDALERVRVRTPREIQMWAHAPDGLLSGLLQLDPGLAGDVRYKWYCDNKQCSDDDDDDDAEAVASAAATAGLNAACIQWMCDLCKRFLDRHPWLSDAEASGSTQPGNDAVADDEEEAAEGPPSKKQKTGNDGNDVDAAAADVIDGAGDTEWLYSSNAHKFIGKRARVWIDESEFFWEDGTVVAYLPPDDDEPMALWKVRLDAPPRGCKMAERVTQDRLEDLEEHEIIEAMKRAST